MTAPKPLRPREVARAMIEAGQSRFGATVSLARIFRAHNIWGSVGRFRFTTEPNAEGKPVLAITDETEAP